jgi:hypothetical protein
MSNETPTSIYLTPITPLVKSLPVGQVHLPVEILQEILKHNPPKFGISSGNAPGYAPLLVSRSWYTAATCCPLLWRDITTESRELFRPSTGRWFRIWCKRSGKCGLHIIIKCSPWGRAEADREETLPRSAFHTHGFNIMTLASYAPRWISFHYESWVFDGIPIVLRAVQSARNLTSFALKTPINEHRLAPCRRFKDYINPALSLPEITHLRIEFLFGCFKFAQFPRIGGTSVSELWISCAIFQASCFLGMAQAMPNVKKLTLKTIIFCNFQPDSDSFSWAGTIKDQTLFCRLEELNITGSQEHIPEVVLRCGPSLKSISLPWQPNEFLFSAFQSLPDSLCSLAVKWRKDFHDFPVDTPSLTQPLMRLKSLSSLNLTLEGSDTSRVSSTSNPRVSIFVSAVKARNDARCLEHPSLPLLSLCIFQQPWITTV